MNFVNLTPHALNVQTASGEIITIEPSGTVARVSTSAGNDLISIAGIPLQEPTKFGTVEGLPAPEKGVNYIVSMLVAGQVSGRSDVWRPDTGPDAIRENGQIKAVRRLIRAC